MMSQKSKELSIRIQNLDPMPRNRSHMLIKKGKLPMSIKTPLCREFEKDLEQRLLEYKEQLQEFKSSVDLNKNFISATYYVFTPKALLTTKSGAISSRTLDTDAHKVFRDTIYRCMGLDDKLERDTRIVTPISQDEYYNYVCVFKLENIECLGNTSFAMPSLIEPMKETLEMSALL